MVLKAYTIAYTKCIDLVYTELCRGNVKDGEDCWLDHYGVSVNLEDPAEAVMEVLASAYDRAEERISGPWSVEILKRLDVRSVSTFLHKLTWAKMC